MPHFKDSNGGLHFLENAAFQNLLPAGCIEITDAEAEAIRAVALAPTQEQIEAQFTTAIQKRLDSFAQTRNYDSILSACTYATSTVAKFKTEGQACVNLRDATWAAAYTILANVQAGKRPMPTSIVDIEADLPAAVWPA